MPESVESQMELPIVEMLGDEPVSFPRLDLDDLMAWANEAKAARVKKAEDRFKNNRDLSPVDVQRLLQPMYDQGFEIGNLLAKSYEPEGVRKVLITSLLKSGKQIPDALATLKRIHFRRQLVIAQEVLSAPAPPAATTEPVTGASEAGFTGSGTGVSSEPSPDSRPEENSGQ